MRWQRQRWESLGSGRAHHTLHWDQRRWLRLIGQCLLCMVGHGNRQGIAVVMAIVERSMMLNLAKVLLFLGRRLLWLVLVMVGLDLRMLLRRNDRVR